ncbi:patanin-like phospholipase domain-containing protein atgl-1 [Octopus sinensis]|uniref:Patanin-like phospholipase domain-containing protein atgl-1 n=1 Tax=Octopus sinensis TaxID=2607531 RepID=A0A6P7U092_9MOLL|nr:patanin-like phospholipase domain-containing protein atgl-1 [Octopus sinensis]
MADSQVSVSFAGCGFLGIYHVGVARCMQEHAPHLFTGRFLGSSVGGLIAASLILGHPLSVISDLMIDLSTQARCRFLGPFHPSFNLSKILKRIIKNSFPPNAYQLCSGRLHLSLTRLSDGSNVIVNQFDSNCELIDALMCSCHIPIFSGLVPPKYRRVFYVDGFLSDNLLEFDENTITVSPFCGSVDICPRDFCEMPFGSFIGNTPMQFTLFNFSRLINVVYPPSRRDLASIARQGYHDAHRFILFYSSPSSPSFLCHYAPQSSCSCCVNAYYNPTQDRKSMIFNYSRIISSFILLPLEMIISFVFRFIAYFPEFFGDLRLFFRIIYRQSKNGLKRSPKMILYSNGDILATFKLFI